MNGRTRMAWLGAFLLAGVVTAQPPAIAPGRSAVVATVNDVPITQGEVDAILKAGGPVPVHLPEAQRRKRQMEVLGMLIDNVLMRQFLQQNTPAVTDAEVSKRIEEMEAGLKKQGKSLEEFCQDTNQTMEQFKANVTEHIRWNALVASRASDEVIGKFYAENKDFFDGTTVRASHIVIRVPANATEAEKTKARTTLEKIKQQLQADPKVDFGEMARQYSQDPQGSRSGDLGYIPRKWFDEAFARAAFGLAIGQISDVVTTEFGVHLIKVTDRKPGKPVDFEMIKDAVREFYAEDLRQQVLNAQREAAKKAGKLVINNP